MEYDVEQTVDDEAVRIRYDDQMDRSANEMAGDVEQFDMFQPADADTAEYAFEGELDGYEAEVEVYDDHIELELDLTSGSTDIADVMDAAEQARGLLEPDEEYAIDVPEMWDEAELPDQDRTPDNDRIIGGYEL
ncbi:MAG: hypothetical protein MUP66_01110 [Candidatus Nanohaloarchaeota archaeon QJJ-5]|nr:hypothetical protein [Candidatus Nanohaloarchaeota archaeon QJJ-5]